jgi:hypothetical protein
MESETQKISAGLQARLDRMPRDVFVRAVVVLNTGGAADRRARRQSPEERQAAVARTKATASELLPQVDSVLSEAGGRRLSDSPDALGAIIVEASPAGIRRLAESSSVKAILEDQTMVRVR